VFSICSALLFLTFCLYNKNFIFSEVPNIVSCFILFNSSIFFYYGITFLITPLFNAKFLSTRAGVQIKTNSEILPSVAIFYMTCDDFDPVAVGSCIQQDYPCHHVYVLDDSTEQSFIDMVNKYKDRCSFEVMVVRRNTRSGYKAGNINHGLRQLTKDIDFVLLVDADEVLPKGFLSATMSRMMAFEEDIAFIQASSRGRPDPDNPFAHDLHVFVDMYWRHFLPLKDKYGFSAALGHGILIRRDALDAIGGFPELVSEDIALTLTLKEAGFDGVHESEVFGYESFPPSLEAFRRRQYRWTKADLQLCFKMLSRYITTTRLELTERLDAATREVKLPLTCLVAPTIMAGAVLSLYTPKIQMAPALLPLIGIILLVGLSPIWCFCWHLRQSSMSLARFIPKWFFVALNLIFLHFVAPVTFLINQNVIFHPTGSINGKKSISNPHNTAVSLSPSSTLFIFLEIGFGASLFLIAILTYNLLLTAIATAILCLVPVQKLGWNHPVSSLLQVLPSILFILGILTDFISGSIQISSYLVILGFAMVLI